MATVDELTEMFIPFLWAGGQVINWAPLTEEWPEYAGVDENDTPVDIDTNWEPVRGASYTNSEWVMHPSQVLGDGSWIPGDGLYCVVPVTLVDDVSCEWIGWTLLKRKPEVQRG